MREAGAAQDAKCMRAADEELQLHATKKRDARAKEIECLTRKVQRLSRMSKSLPLSWNLLSMCVQNKQLSCDDGKRRYIVDMWKTQQKTVWFQKQTWLAEARNFTYVTQLLRMSGVLTSVLERLRHTRPETPSLWSHPAQQARFLRQCVVKEQQVLSLIHI